MHADAAPRDSTSHLLWAAIIRKSAHHVAQKDAD